MAKKVTQRQRKGSAKNLTLYIIIAILIIALAMSIALGSSDSLLSIFKGNNDHICPVVGCNKAHLYSDITLSSGEKLVISFINVGQGDGILVELPDGQDILIDGGSGTSNPSASNTDLYLLNYLKTRNLADIDYLIATHPDADHINMLDNVLDKYVVNNIYYNNYEHTSQTFKTFKEKSEAEGANIVLFDSDGEVYSISDANKTYEVSIYAPGFNRFTDVNSMSPIITIKYGGQTIVLTGDAHSDTEEWFLSQIPADFDASVLKVGHHGSESSSSSAFLSKIKAEYAVISVGEVNSYNHPNPFATSRLYDNGMATYQTNKHGNIKLLVDEKGGFAFDLDNRLAPLYNRNNRDPMLLAV